MSQAYHPEKYWDQVAKNILSRNDSRLIAGDDEPYYQYKRKKFLELLDSMDFSDKKILEFGSGPGGNLAHLHSLGCNDLTGVDISNQMIKLAAQLLEGKNIQLQKIDSSKLPFDHDSFDLVFTATVLQHNTNEAELKKIISEICRVSKHEVYLFERIEKQLKGHDSNLGRPINYYAELMLENGFKLIETRAIKIQASYYICGFIRKVFNSKKRKEGESLSKFSIFLEQVLLPFTKQIDKIIPSKRDVMFLKFQKEIES